MLHTASGLVIEGIQTRATRGFVSPKRRFRTTPGRRRLPSKSPTSWRTSQSYMISGRRGGSMCPWRAGCGKKPGHNSIRLPLVSNVPLGTTGPWLLFLMKLPHGFRNARIVLLYSLTITMLIIKWYSFGKANLLRNLSNERSGYFTDRCSIR